MQFRNGEPYTPKCTGTGPIPSRDDRGRSVRCGECLVIAVHPNGDWQQDYVHWTDSIPDGSGRTWMDVATRDGNAIGRLHVPADWASR